MITADYLNHFRARVLQDALTEALADGWERRAETFAQAAPKPGDYRGRATAAQLSEARERCLATAQACRRHALLIRQGLTEDEASADVRAALQEVA